MFKKQVLFLIPLFLFLNFNVSAQVDEDETGAWYMYIWDTGFNKSNFGLQGDVQYRNWTPGFDLQQLILRAAVTYSLPETRFRFSAGYGHFTSGSYGESDATSLENRLHQDVNFAHALGKRFLFSHRLRLEQRWVENQDFRTRYRYALFLNVPLNKTVIEKNAFYLAFWDEIFINGQEDIGDGLRVNTVDRNWFYSGLGYSILDNMRVQLGYMYESTKTLDKGQVQLSLFHSF